ncbi:MAG: hypothetical protein ACRCVG_02815 [Methanobacteriaceae archaeon]
MIKKKTSLSLDNKLMKDLKIMATKLDKTQSALLEEYLKKGIEHDKKLLKSY